MNKAKRSNMVRVPMTDLEADAVRKKAEEIGIPIARLIRRCVFGVRYEVERQIDPTGSVEPTITLAECKVRVTEK
jgi:hypothetical protein